MARDLNDLIPVPRRVEPLESTLDVQGLHWLLDARSGSHTAVAWKVEQELGVPWGVSQFLDPPTLVVGEPAGDPPAPPQRQQGYALHVGPDGLCLRGHDMDGLYWGLVTLEQMLDGGCELPCAHIVDWPEFRLRGHHDDISRKQVSKLDDFCRIIRKLSGYKINVYTPYMEDMLYLKSHPDIGEGRGRLMPAELAEMHSVARRHNVMIMPTYSLIGHQENLLADPKYAHLGREVFQSMSSLDVTKPEVRQFLTDVIRDVCELFPCPYFHGGFDETQGVGAEEFLEHANWCARELRKYGKRMPMWVDMIYNHFGYEMIERLEENIIPVNWQYGCTEEVPHQRELTEQGRPVWGLAGYGNCCAFLPVFDRGKSNIDAWREVGVQTDTPALFASQWGDNGYENHRDMCWNMFAYLGEAAWSGSHARREDFERRFQLSFYGAEIPELMPIVESLARDLSLSPRDIWAHFRRNAFGMVRWAAENPDAADDLAEDERRLTEALESVPAARRKAVREEEHLEHFRVSLLRTLSVVHRLQFALDYVKGLAPGEVEERVEDIRTELEDVREAYEADWLRTNKRPNIEVSLSVYDEVLASYAKLPEIERAEAGRRDGYYVCDLAEQFNRSFLPVGGLPVGEEEVNGVPFLFADEHNTHVEITPETGPVELEFPELPLKDLYLIVAAHKTADEPEPAAVVELERDGKVVFSEELLNILHLCDWWAPLGEHIWAGGGMAHVDTDRVRYALKPGAMYGLADTSGFDLPALLTADTLRISAQEGQELRLFAVTLELAED